MLFLLVVESSAAQQHIKGKVIDAITREAVPGATIHCTDQDCTCGCATSINGDFDMKCMGCKKMSITAIGYKEQQAGISGDHYVILLSPATSLLREVVVSAARGEAVRRSEAPIAITLLNAATLQDAKPTTADQVLNKVSGVNMVNLGNEQHEMSIRQPMTTRSLFLYLEDGIPIRTTGLYNHNALLEMNLAATKSIEVIKGPSSSLYGSEAIGGVVNFITLAPTATPLLRLSVQGNNIGYKRADLQASYSKNKWGFVLSGYGAEKDHGFLEYSDYHKLVFTGRADYHFSDRTVLSTSITWMRYFSDMPGGIDSTMFARHVFSNLQTFTYRKVDALRYHSTLTHNWKSGARTTVSILYRNNTIGQNPAYRIKDDYHRQGNVFVGRKDLAHGEINNSSFNSYAFIAQHRQNFGWKRAALTAGLSADISPSTYNARYIRIRKDSVSGKYTGYQPTDSTLTDYKTGLNNYAAFTSFELSPVKKLRIVASLRYDLFHYAFNNHLTPSAYSGSPDTVSHFNRVSPKIGLTYNFSDALGIYANYSEGFVPPQVSELYTGVKVPVLAPSVFYNYELGGWMSMVHNKLSADISLYRLNGTNEIISVKLDDGSFINQNAGQTAHTGIELGLNAAPHKDVSLRLSGSYSHHEFVQYIEKGVSYNGNEMNNAPHWIYNAECWYRPHFIGGLRIGAELQHVGRYFDDPQNTAVYNGYNVLNLRTGYRFGAVEIWLNVLNATDNYYSYITTKSASGYSYQLAEPRNFNAGLSCDLASLFKKKP